jgi:acylglycerol lipase
MTEDLRTLAALVRARHPQAVLAVVGESMGGAVAICAFASDRPPTADRLVLIAPALWGPRSQAWLYERTLWLGAYTVGGLTVRPPDALLRRIRASDNTEHLYRMGADPNIIFRTRIDTLYGLVGLMRRAAERMPFVHRPPPVFYAYGRNDQIIAPEPSFRAAAALKPGDRSAWYRDGWHMLTRDLQGERVTRDIAAFLRDPSAPLPSGAPPIPARAGRRTAALVAGAPEA